mgnify:CR=1 FL=1
MIVDQKSALQAFFYQWSNLFYFQIVTNLMLYVDIRWDLQRETRAAKKQQAAETDRKFKYDAKSAWSELH